MKEHRVSRSHQRVNTASTRRRLLRGRYERLAVVREGVDGVLLRALDHLHERDVAIKVRTPRTPAERAALLAEGRSLLGMRPHPGVSLVRDDFFVGTQYHLVMDWVEGTSLASLLLQKGRPGLPLEEVVGWIEQLAEVLDHLHNHHPPIVHGDVTPGNVVLTEGGGVVLVDHSVGPEEESEGRGGPSFKAPELTPGEAPTVAADVFSLAATTAALLTGSVPRSGSRPGWPSVAAKSNARVSQELRRGLAPDPQHRPASAGAFSRALHAFDKPNNLPVASTSFVGREREIAEIEELLGSTRLVTLTGAGGCGKSRLALEVADHLLAEFPDGAFMVELAPLADPNLVAGAVAAALGVGEVSDQPLIERLCAHLSGRRLLLVLDSCEHLLGACAELVAMLLRQSAELRVLVTSRESLGLAGERRWRVPPLTTPEQGTPLDDLFDFEAVQLFVDRVRAADREFRLDDATGGAVREISRRLDGLPLALELAAAQVRLFGVNEVASRLDDRLWLLTRGSRTAPARQQTLSATLDWSHDLLPAYQQALLRRLAIFAGGSTLDAAEDVCAGDDLPRGAILDTLTALVDKSLLVATHHESGTRYGLLETVREYAHKKLAAAAELQLLQRRHGAWCLALAEQAELGIVGSSGAEWLRRLDAEHDNLRAGLRAALTNGPTDAALRLAGCLWRFWETRGMPTEGLGWLEAALALPPPWSLQARAMACRGAGNLASVVGDLSRAHRFHDESLALSRETGDSIGVARALGNLAVVENRLGHYHQAYGLSRESADLYTALGHPGALYALANLSFSARRLGRVDEALLALNEAITLARACGDETALVHGLLDRSYAHWSQHRYSDAARDGREALCRAQELNARLEVAYGLLIVGATVGMARDPRAGARLLASAATQYARMSLFLDEEDRQLNERAEAAIRAALSATEFAEEWNTGTRLALTDAMTLALDACEGISTAGVS
jgi:predicted ATPase